MRLIDADELYRAKFHGMAEIVTPDEKNVESYKRGWNDALDAVADESCTPTISLNRWIPCSERLPEKHRMVITTIKGVDLFRECADKNFFEALATAKKRTLVSVGYLGDDGWYGADGFPQIIPTVAWMPMPEAYGGEEDE